MVRGVLFDVGEVLVRSPLVEDWLAPWPQRLGLPPQEFAARVTVLEGLGGDDGLGFSTGRVSEAAYREAAVEVLGLDGAGADAWMAALWDWYCGELDVALYAYADLMRRNGYRVGILSNSFDGARREEQRRFGFSDAFDPLVYSHEVGLAKPDPRIFSLAAQRIGLAPDEIVFVDDLVANVEAARACGLHAVLHETAASTMQALETLIGGPAAG